MDMLLKGKRALVTGSTSGIGAQCARVLAGEGVSIVINGRNADRAAAVSEEIRKVGGEAKFVLGDVTTEDGSNALLLRGLYRLSTASISSVNNVGNPTRESHDSWFDAPFQEWIDDYHQNTIAAVRLIHAFTPAMKERGWGRLIQVSSRNAISPSTRIYRPTEAAKAALQQRDHSACPRSLLELASTSNGVMPGLSLHTATEQAGSSRPRKGKEATTLKFGKRYALKDIIRQTVSRLGQPMDIAAAGLLPGQPANRLHDRHDVPYRWRLDTHRVEHWTANRCSSRRPSRQLDGVGPFQSDERRAQLRVGCAQPPRRAILCWRDIPKAALNNRLKWAESLRPHL